MLTIGPTSTSGVDVQQTQVGYGRELSAGNRFGFVYRPQRSGQLSEVDLYLYRYGTTTNNITVELWSLGADGTPANLMSSLGTIPASAIDQTYNWRPLMISNAPTVTAGTAYAVVFYPSGGTGDYASGDLVFVSSPVGWDTQMVGGVWSKGFDADFRVFVNSAQNLSVEPGAATLGVGIADSNLHAIQITPTSTGALNHVAVRAYQYAGSMAGITFGLYSDNGNDMPGPLIANLGRIAYNSPQWSSGCGPQCYDWRTLTVANAPTVTAGQKYWLVWWRDQQDGTGNIAVSADFTGSFVSQSVDGGTTWLYQQNVFRTYVY